MVRELQSEQLDQLGPPLSFSCQNRRQLWYLRRGSAPAPEWQTVPQEATDPQEWETQPRRQTSDTSYQFMLPLLQ